ncbi:radical SAM/SPASM domain-containing protein [Pseudomonas amygdali]|nr:radical SAM protein [Pseudomonas amygdali]KPC16911.1 putative transcriptional regulator [Pseudomonas amygdali pv. lachrymans]KPC17870.1 putative transcriptional regulator [Pseudomonas amygdali pv. lachrymans]RMT06388.1 putative transcriptional regulator [Pseudomonas amygdali pv. lachrymans]
MIGVVIAKPTKLCNADCSYCSSPPDGSKPWGEEQLVRIFSSLKGHLEPKALFLWHGGEPLLMGPDFYRKAHAIAKELTPEIEFAVQTNLLLYKTKQWKGVFEDIFGGACSTSYEPDEKQRTIKGDPVKYSRTFFRKLEEFQADGFNPLVIGTFTEETADLMHLMYDKSIERGDRSYHLRMNYCSPVGRESGSGLLIEPETYGRKLIEIYDRWIADVPGFVVTPLDLMLRKVLGQDLERCPWTRKCGGAFMGIMPNGDVYNCGEFSDLSDDWRYGNILEGTYTPGRQAINFVRKAPVELIVPNLMASPAARTIKRRAVLQPLDCQSCRHFKECQGGCARDVVLYNQGIGGKFMYCRSWKMVFDRIKASILSGEADRMIEWFGADPSAIRAKIERESLPSDLDRWAMTVC